MTGSIGKCQKCSQRGYIMPLHGDKGGPLFCPPCIGAWHGEHGKKLKWRRIVVKALQGYEKAGGALWKDKDALWLAASGQSLPGFNAEHMPHEIADLTSELLTDTIQLTHPDRHPPERRDLAQRVTAALLALTPYVFPTPKPEPPPVYKPRDGSSKKNGFEITYPSKPTYPCDLCADALPRDYCNACKAEWEKRQQEERGREKQKRNERNARNRLRYAERTRWRDRGQKQTHCSNCGVEFRAKRQDAKYCSASCRQKAYLKRDGKPSNDKSLNRAELRRAIESVFAAEPDWAFTTNELCKQALALTRPERRHRTAVLAACKAAGMGIMFSESRGCTRLIFRLDSLMGYAVARQRAWLWHLYEKPERIKANLAPGGKEHHYIAEGGHWVRHWRMFVAETRGETKTPQYQKLKTEQAAVNASWSFSA
jgi:hypothetical protein